MDQVGYAVFGAQSRAGLWRGTAATWVDLHPQGAQWSDGWGTFDGQQVGYSRMSGLYRACVWTGSAESCEDLSTTLGGGNYGDTVARSIWNDGATVFVCGDGFNLATGRGETLLWTRTTTPRVVRHPMTTSACLTGSASFRIVAAGPGQLGYRWQVDVGEGTWMDIPQGGLTLPCGGSVFADDPTRRDVLLTVVPCSGRDAYPVRCVVSTSYGTVTSDAATYMVCYPNCDCSTATPKLNVADFTCFLQSYANAETYANCDGSTTEPTLNVADFTCFLQKYALGCN
jgi:hypothetical protein